MIIAAKSNHIEEDVGEWVRDNEWIWHIGYPPRENIGEETPECDIKAIHQMIYCTLLTFLCFSTNIPLINTSQTPVVYGDWPFWPTHHAGSRRPSSSAGYARARHFYAGWYWLWELHIICIHNRRKAINHKFNIRQKITIWLLKCCVTPFLISLYNMQEKIGRRCSFSHCKTL